MPGCGTGAGDGCAPAGRDPGCPRCPVALLCWHQPADRDESSRCGQPSAQARAWPEPCFRQAASLRRFLARPAEQACSRVTCRKHSQLHQQGTHFQSALDRTRQQPGVLEPRYHTKSVKGRMFSTRTAEGPHIFRQQQLEVLDGVPMPAQAAARVCSQGGRIVCFCSLSRLRHIILSRLRCSRCCLSSLSSIARHARRTCLMTSNTACPGAAPAGSRQHLVLLVGPSTAQARAMKLERMGHCT